MFYFQPNASGGRCLAVAAAAAHPWHGAWSTRGGLLRALPLACPASTPHASPFAGIRFGAFYLGRRLGRAGEIQRRGGRERDRQRRWHYEKYAGQDCDEKAAGHHFLPRQE
jgi:hypothetical protein